MLWSTAFRNLVWHFGLPHLVFDFLKRFKDGGARKEQGTLKLPDKANASKCSEWGKNEQPTPWKVFYATKCRATL